MSVQNTNEKSKNKLQELYNLGKSKGSLTYDEIISSLSSYEIDPEQFESILDDIESQGIQVTKDPQDTEADRAIAEANLIVEELDDSVTDGISIDDPVRMYLK